MDDSEYKVGTVKIVSPDHEGGFAVINKADFDPAKDVEYTEKADKAKTFSRPVAAKEDAKKSDA